MSVRKVMTAPEIPVKANSSALPCEAIGRQAHQRTPVVDRNRVLVSAVTK